MNAQEIAEKVLEVVKEAPEKAQELVSDPKGAVEKICGETDFDVNDVVQLVLEKAGDLEVDLSHLDLSKLSQDFDLSKLDLSKLSEIAQKANIDVSKIDLGTMTNGLLSNLGGLFGKK